jgi:hypothetical protein
MSVSAISSLTLPQIIQNIILCEQRLEHSLVRTNLHRRRKTLEEICNIMMTLVQRIDELLNCESYTTRNYEQILNQLAEKRLDAEKELANSYIDFGNAIEEIDNIRVEEEVNGGVREPTQQALLCAINIMRLSREAKVARGENPNITESMAYILDGGIESLIGLFGSNLLLGEPVHKKLPKLYVSAIDIPDKFEDWVDTLPNIGSTLLDSICCPITQEVMHDPVITIDGYTFERSAISTWLETNANCPLSRQPLINKKLTINWNCRKYIISLIEDFLNRENFTTELVPKPPTPIYINNFNKPQNKWQTAKNLIRLITNT